MFVHYDRSTGDVTPTMFDLIAKAMRGRLIDDVALQPTIPEQVRQRMETAIDLYALAIEQLTLERERLFNSLVNSAVSSAQPALEPSLKQSMQPIPPVENDRDDHRTLGFLIKQARVQGLFQNKGYWDDHWGHVLQDRNDLTHGHTNAVQYGVTAWNYMQVIFQTIGRLVAEQRI